MARDRLNLTCFHKFAAFLRGANFVFEMRLINYYFTSFNVIFRSGILYIYKNIFHKITKFYFQGEFYEKIITRFSRGRDRLLW